MKAWKVSVSIMAGLIISLTFITTITGSRNTLSDVIKRVGNIEQSMFYKGITMIVMSIVMLCVVIIICTLNIIKAINENKRGG